MPTDKFEALYQRIALPGNLCKAPPGRLDNWAVDRYETPDGYFAGMADAGYSRFVGRRVAGQVWRVDWAFGKPLVFYKITAAEFAQID